MSRKVLYKGAFNYEGEKHILYCRANNEGHAFNMLCVQLACKLNRSSWTIRQYFWGTDKYKIALEPKRENVNF